MTRDDPKDAAGEGDVDLREAARKRRLRLRPSYRKNQDWQTLQHGLQELRDMSLHLLAPCYRIAQWRWKYLLDSAIDMSGHGDRMPGGI